MSRGVIGTLARRGRSLLRRIAHRRTPEPSSLGRTFLTLALQYYIAGRCSYFAFSMPVAGNLLHHGVEMLLKSVLAENGVTESHLQYKFGHNVRRLWTATKRTLGNPELGTYDDVIWRLAPMWEIRYPRRDRRRYSFKLSLRKEPTVPPTASATRELPHYQLSLQEVDELMSAVLAKIATPEWVKGQLGWGYGRTQYLRDNHHSFI